MMEVLPLCTFPTSHTTGANWRALSAMGVLRIGGLAHPSIANIGSGGQTGTTHISGT